MSETLARYARDYPAGPHDQPQSMCPAFGALRVGLRMRRTASVLSGSACCVYGLTFTSHFYGARRTVGYVPFNSETLVTGKLFEDIRDAVFKLADPDNYDAIVVINLCVPTASGVPLRLLPKEINGVRIIGIDVPGFGVPTHAEAKDVLAGAMLNFARHEAEQGPVQAPREPALREAGGDAARRNVPGRSGSDRRDARSSRPCGRTGRSDARMARALWRARLRRGRRDSSVLHRQRPRVRSWPGRPVVGSAPVGYDGTAAWLDAIGAACGVAAARGRRGEGQAAAGDQGRPGPSADPGPHHAVGLRRLGTARRALAGRERRRPALRRHRLPAHAFFGRRPRVAGRPRASTSNIAPRSSRISRRSTSSSPTSRSARRRWCRRPRSARSRRSISPI